MVAHTGAGKTTHIMDYYRKNKDRKLCFVSPINSLSLQVVEDHGDVVQAINGETIDMLEKVRDVAAEYLHSGYSLVISYTTFFNIWEDLEMNGYDIWFDEAHKFINSNITNEQLDIIRNGKYYMTTATPEGLDVLFPKYKMVTYDTLPKYKRDITYVMPGKGLKYNESFMLQAIKDIYKKEKKPLVVHINDKLKANKFKLELKSKYDIKLYNADVKDVFIKDCKFTEEFDILFCTSSLTEGVSIKQDVVLVYIDTVEFTSIPSIRQFISRVRNEKSQCYLITRHRSTMRDTSSDYDMKFKERERYEHLEQTKGHYTHAHKINEELEIAFAFMDIRTISQALRVDPSNNPQGIMFVNDVKRMATSWSDNVLDKLELIEAYESGLFFDLKCHRRNNKFYYLIKSVLMRDGESESKMYEEFGNENDAVFYKLVDMKASDIKTKLSSYVVKDELAKVDYSLVIQKFIDNNGAKLDKEFKRYFIDNFNIKKETLKNESLVKAFLNNYGYTISRPVIDGKKVKIIIKI
jgi:hypothetical protein